MGSLAFIYLTNLRFVSFKCYKKAICKAGFVSNTILIMNLFVNSKDPSSAVYVTSRHSIHSTYDSIVDIVLSRLK